MEVHDNFSEPWRVSLIDTGSHTQTGGRLKRVLHIKHEEFFLSHGDGLSDVNIDKLISYHREHNKLATLTAVKPPGRYGAVRPIRKSRKFIEKDGDKISLWRFFCFIARSC